MAKKNSKATASRKSTRLAGATLAKKRPASVAVRTAAPGQGGPSVVQRAPAEAKRYILGSSSIFTPQVMNDIHIKSELGRYRMRGFSLFKKIPHWDDLTFLPGTLTRFVIEGYREKCETKTAIGPPAKRQMVSD